MPNNAMIEAALNGLKTATKPWKPTEDEAMFALPPDDLAVRQLQMSDPVASNMSREDIARSKMGELRQAFGLDVAKSEQAIRQAVVPRQIEGEYRLRAAQAKADADAARFAQGQDRQDQRAAANRSAMDARSAANREAVSQRMAAGREQRGAPVTARNKLMSMRAAAEKAGAAETGGMFSNLKQLFGGAAPENTKLKSFDQASELAQAIATDYPDADIDDALMDMGQDELSPEEYAQVGQILYLLRGR
jgi:hypothetical protein